jgi:hypothetical protein
MASESSLASAPFREDRITLLSLLHRNYGSSDRQIKQQIEGKREGKIKALAPKRA